MPDNQTTEEPDADRFKPGTHGCHEALDRAMICYELVAERLCEHPAVKANPEWLELAQEARAFLFTLYQSIGEKHL
jgi:hypothetical protein